MKKISLLLFTLFILSSAFSQNVQKDKDIGKEANEQIIAQIGVFDHDSKNILDQVGNKLVENIDDRVFDYQFAILDMLEPNAMALPGGYVYFSRGILVLANSEDELAGVMGHEITHVHNRHSRKAMNRSIFTAILQVPGALLGTVAPVAGAAVNAPLAAGAGLYNSGYSRSNEKEADKEGAMLAAKSGYDPNGLPEILHKISEDVKLMTGEEETSSWFDSHPYTPKRVDELTKTIGKLDYTPAVYDFEVHHKFIANMEGLCIGPNPASGVFVDTKFLHPEMNFSMAFPEGWKTVNTPMALGFMAPDEKAQLVFSLADTVQSPDLFAEAFLKEYYKNYTSKPVRNESYSMNGFPAHIIQFEQVSNDTKVIASVLWLTRDNRTYQFMEISEEKYKKVIEDMANSLNVITDEERNLIYQTLVHIVKAEEGETIEELSKRTGNSLELDYTSLINNVSTDTKLSGDRWVKIGVKTKY